MRCLLAVLFASVFAFSAAQAQYLNISPQGLTAGSTPVTGCTSLNLFYNNAGTLACMSGTSWDNTNRSLTITGATVATSKPILGLTQTWNGAGVVFTGLSFDITNTASSGSSLIFQFSLGGASRLSLSPTGVLTAASNIVGGSIISNTGSLFLGSGLDMIISRRGAANLRLGQADAASPIAQTLSVQGASGTNVAGAAALTVVGPLATGNAAPGDIILQTGAVGASGATASTATTALTIKGGTQQIVAANSIQTPCTTIAGLGSAGSAGRRWCVSNQLTSCPVLGGTFTAGGSVVCSAFDDGSNWTHQ